MGISEIDEEHKKLIDILNQAIFAKENNDNPEKIKQVLKEMSDYALTHFKTEETYMKKCNNAGYQNHKEEHRNFYIETIAFHDKVFEGDCQVATEILEYLKWWLVNHIQNTDKKYISCFSENGLK